MGAILKNPDINNLIFLHVPKCAGSTFLSILNRQYPHLNHFDIKLLSPDELNISELISQPEKKIKQINLIKGHQTYGLHKHLIGNSSYISFVRDPVERISSLYHYVKNIPDNRFYSVIHKHKLSLKDFVQKLEDPGINNTQLFRIGGIPEEPEEIQLQQALRNVEKHFPVVGVVERYDESLMLLKNYFKWNWPYYSVVNKNKKKSSKTVSPDIEEFIREKNQGDLKLYKAMEKRLDEQIKNSSENISKQLKRFNAINQLMVHPYMFNAYSKLRQQI